jgi:hypothetical protein
MAVRAQYPAARLNPKSQNDHVFRRRLDRHRTFNRPEARRQRMRESSGGEPNRGRDLV